MPENLTRSTTNTPVAQLEERLRPKERVGGSIPPGGANLVPRFADATRDGLHSAGWLAGRSRRVAKAGSIPPGGGFL